MAKGFAIHNALTDHGGIIPSTQVRSSQMGHLFVRAGDGHFCPKCKCWSMVVKSHDHIIFDDKAVAYVGDQLTCGAKILPQQSHVVGESGGANYATQSNSSFVDSKNNSSNNFIKDEKYNISLDDIIAEPFVPLGVPALDGKPSNSTLKFHGKILAGIFEAICLEVKKDGKFIEISRVKKLFTANQKFSFKWDGFIDGIYDSKFYTSLKGVEFRLKGFNGGNEMCLNEKLLHFKYFNKDWMDVYINKKTSYIYITLRVNMIDGGTYGLDTGWRRVPKSVIKFTQPLQHRTLSFTQLKKMAIEGMNYHWSRNNKNSSAQNILLDGKKYEVTINSIESATNSMPAMPLMFASNWMSMRSCNWELSRKTYYNTGYIEFQTISGNPNDSDWEFWEKSFSDKKFKYVFAHEMGHEILLAYGGQTYSKMHKGSSSLISQSPSVGTSYPQSGEIDLMKYAQGNSRGIPFFEERSIAAERDVASLLFIAGISKK